MSNTPIAKIGYVTIALRNRSLRLRFTYPKGCRREMTVARDSIAGLQKARQLATQIDKDIIESNFDESLARYR
jgi:hypothetical protein